LHTGTPNLYNVALMNIKKCLPPEAIMVGVRATDKWDLMEQMLDWSMSQAPDMFFEEFTREKIWKALKKREKMQSTGVGAGFAFPHARLAPFNHFVMCLAILDEPIDFESSDGQPVHMACMLLANAEKHGTALKVMSKISSIVADPLHRETLQRARTNEEAYDFLLTQDLQLDMVVYAENVMIAPPFRVLPDMPISKVTHQMLHHRVSATAVQDEEGRLVGEITSDGLFQYGMPDFFKQLQSVSFVANFNPLDEYFEIESSVCAGDLMTMEYAELNPKSTLIEAIFELSVKHHNKVYVTDDGKLVGVIDRLSVIDRAINF
jgi:mannitol/fructose-specific phosphotransferase system IIA component (Ntr-type)/CBS domain-containing protein